MAEYRKVHTKIWDDDWFYTLDAEGKVLWFYLITNRNASVAGIYECSLRVMAYEAGIPPARAEELLAAFQQAGKIEREGDVIWVKRLRHYQESASPKVQTGIRNDVNGIEDCSVKRHYLSHYNIPSDTVSDSIEPFDTAPHRDRDYTETETETETESGDEKAPSPPPTAPRKSKRDPRTDHPAIKAVSAVTGKRPPLQVYGRIIAAVGDRPDTERMGEVFQRWLAHGYSPVNLEGWLFDWYVKGIPQQQARAPNPAQRNGTEPVGMAGLNEWRRQKGLKSGEP